MSVVRAGANANLRVGSASKRSKPVEAAMGVVHAHCAVYTSPEVACSILDRIGWVASADLGKRRLLEPSCGDGSFLLPAIERLLESRRGRGGLAEECLSESVVAFEFDESTASALRTQVVAKLRNAGLSKAVAERIGARWIRCEDFLLARDLTPFTDIVGNPPYMRWSKVPAALRSRYESGLPKHAARGDLCLAFVCRSVELLAPTDSRVAFLCSDRWLRCSYGSKARVELERNTRLVTHIGVHDVPVFTGSRKVDAHAAVTILERSSARAAVVCDASSVADLHQKLMQPTGLRSTPLSAGLRGGLSAVLASQELAEAFQSIVNTYPPIETVGLEVRCGMALGCAPAFVVEGQPTVEKGRLVPFARTGDLQDSGEVTPTSHVVNVWAPNGELVDLSKFPKLSSHLETYRTRLAQRACVRTPETWYRTIDRLDLNRLRAPKLLVAGMSKFARVAMSPGGTQHSNALYAITSSEWPLQALFALFRAGALDLFAAVLSPRFSGDVKRFDGNVLRQVRLPRWSEVNTTVQSKLLASDAKVRDAGLVLDVYCLADKRHRRAIEAAIELGETERAHSHSVSTLEGATGGSDVAPWYIAASR